MDHSEAIQKFRQADELYRQGYYVDALALLDALDECYPRTRRLMYPRALCLYRLGRRHEAVTLAREIVERFGYDKARVLEAHIQNEFALEEGHAVSGEQAPPEPDVLPPGGGMDAYLAAHLAAAPSPRSRTGLVLAVVTAVSVALAVAGAWWALGRLGML